MTDLIADNTAISRRLHRDTYGVFAGLLFGLVVVAWIAYGGGAYASLTFVVCTVVALFFSAFLAMLAAAERYQQGRPGRRRLRDRLQGEVVVESGRIPTRDAFLEILLPPGAMLLAFIGIGIVFAVVVPG